MNVNQVGYEQRLAVIKKVLDGYGLKAETVTPVAFSLQFPWPFNNFIYQIDLQSPASASTFPGTQPGTSPAPDAGLSSFIIRMGNLKVSDLNHTNRLENEVACSALAREAIKAAGLGSLVPEIYAWSPPKSFDALDEENFGWSICELKTGTDLDTEFPSLSPDGKKNVIQQLADIYAALQKAVIPATVDKFGGVTFDKEGKMVSGQIAMRKGGPWATLSGLWTEKLQGIFACAKETSFLKTSGNGDEKLHTRVKEFLDNGGVTNSLAGVDTTQRCLVHSDFTMNNLLFDRRSGKITALIDFDFASINHPVEEHYFSSFSDLGGGLRALSPAMYPCVMLDAFEQQPSNLTDDEKKNRENAKMWNEAIAQRHVLRPKTMPGVEKIEALRRFEESLQKMLQDEKSFRGKYPEDGDQDAASPVATVTRMLAAHHK